MKRLELDNPHKHKVWKTFGEDFSVIMNFHTVFTEPPRFPDAAGATSALNVRSDDVLNMITAINKMKPT